MTILDQRQPGQLAKLGVFGQPFHGLWKGGQVALPNATNKTFPLTSTTGELNEGGGNAMLVQRAGWTAPARTSEEAAADATAGYQWLPYALQSGPNLELAGHGLGTNPALGTYAWIYIDGNGVRWRIKASIIHNGSAGYYQASLWVQRFGHFDGQAHAEKTGALPNVLVDLNNFSWTTASMILAAKNRRGSEIIWVRKQMGTTAGLQYWPWFFVRLTVSGIGDETKPLCGLTFSASDYWSASYNVREVTGQTGTESSVVKLWPCYTDADELVWFSLVYQGADNIVLDEALNATGTMTMSAGYFYAGTVLHQVGWTFDVETDVYASTGGSLGTGADAVPQRRTVDLGVEMAQFSHVADRPGGGNWVIYYPWRYSNALMGLIEMELASVDGLVAGDAGFPYWAFNSLGGSIVETRLHDTWGPKGEHATVTGTAAGSPAPAPIVSNGSGGWNGTFGTYHPITGDIHMDTAPVCWV